MSPSMKLRILILSVLAGFRAGAAEPVPRFESGRTYYANGEFKKAAAAFQSALRDDPDNAELCYQAGVSYQKLGDIATPFEGRYYARARTWLTKAVQLAPGRADYRRALFDLLLDSAASSRTALPAAARLLDSMPESDPEYPEMRRRLEDERNVNSSVEARLGRLFLLGPRAAYRLASICPPKTQ